VHFPPQKKVDYLFLVVRLKTQAKTTKLKYINHSHRPDLPISLKIDFCSAMGCTFCLHGGALTTFPCKLDSKIVSRPGGARAPSAPPGYAYATQIKFMKEKMARRIAVHGV